MRSMYNEWPFFQVTIDLIEMVFAKADPRVAEMYDRLLVSIPGCTDFLLRNVFHFYVGAFEPEFHKRRILD